MTKSFRVRPRKISDLPQLCQTLSEVHERDGYPVEGIKDPALWLEIRDALGLWVAEVDGLVAGHVALTKASGHDESARIAQATLGIPLESLALVQRLFVSPKSRRLGLGKALLDAALYEANGRGMIVLLDVMDKDAAAIRLYEKNGWSQIGAYMYSTESKTFPARAFAYLRETTSSRS